MLLLSNAARQRGEEQGLSDEEIAFYDALAENDSAIQIMGDDKLKLILRKYGYPPDLQDAAVQIVLQQAEALSSGWAI